MMILLYCTVQYSTFSCSKREREREDASVNKINTSPGKPHILFPGVLPVLEIPIMQFMQGDLTFCMKGFI